MDELYPCVVRDELSDGVVVGDGRTKKPPGPDVEDIGDKDRVKSEADVAHKDGGGPYEEDDHEQEVRNPMALIEGGGCDGVSQVIKCVELELGV